MDLFLNPRHSFNLPFKVGLDGKKIVLGRYSPTLDSIAILANTENYKGKNVLENVFQTKDPLEKSVQAHEFWGHVKLTKHSSFWTNLFLTNIYSYLGFGRIMYLTEMGLGDEKKERIRKDFRDLITFDNMIEFLHNLWRPLQETLANCYLLKIQSQVDDPEHKKIINTLVWEQNRENKTITNLTKDCNFIMKEIGYEEGWKLLNFMSIEASSPEIIRLSSKPKNYDEIRNSKGEMFDTGYFEAKNDPYMNNPTGRFIELLMVIVRNIDIAKKSFKREVKKLDFVSFVGSMCGHKSQFLPDNLKLVKDQINLLTEKNGIITSETRRSGHLAASNIINIFEEMTKQDYPITWFINDVKTKKIILAPHPLILENDHLWDYVHSSIIRYQLMLSLAKGEDMIQCFGNNLTTCVSDCKHCNLHLKLKVAKDAFRMASEFSYEDLRKDAMDTGKWKERMMT